MVKESADFMKSIDQENKKKKDQQKTVSAYSQQQRNNSNNKQQAPMSKSYNLQYNQNKNNEKPKFAGANNSGKASNFNVLDVVSGMKKSLAKEDPKNKIDVRVREKQKMLENERRRKMQQQHQVGSLIISI